ncbi:MAG TPA: FtsQ-type POTRA domain-containing protein [Gemmatimonadales bacterium]|nr:FtsQ-type POTRA domain-containing protein [Gemmatimonadales bacterium]
MVASRLTVVAGLAGALALGLLVWFGGPVVLRRFDFFRVRRIEVNGARYLAPEAVAAALRLGPRATVFDDRDVLARRVFSVPGVERADVGRRLPGTLVVTVVEREPVALTPRGAKGLAALDARGRLLPYDPAFAAPDLPVVVRADSVVAGVLDVVRDADPALFARISTASDIRGDVLLDLGGRRLWLRGNATAEDIRAVTAVVQDLARRNRGYQELDGRFSGQVIVRSMSSGTTAGAGA